MKNELPFRPADLDPSEEVPFGLSLTRETAFDPIEGKNGFGKAPALQNFFVHLPIARLVTRRSRRQIHDDFAGGAARFGVESHFAMLQPEAAVNAVKESAECERDRGLLGVEIEREHLAAQVRGGETAREKESRDGQDPSREEHHGQGRRALVPMGARGSIPRRPAGRLERIPPPGYRSR